MLSEAFQFNCSAEYAFVNGLRRRVEVANPKLRASWPLWLVAYPTLNHEMLFDSAESPGLDTRGIE